MQHFFTSQPVQYVMKTTSLCPILLVIRQRDQWYFISRELWVMNMVKWLFQCVLYGAERYTFEIDLLWYPAHIKKHEQKSRLSFLGFTFNLFRAQALVQLESLENV